MWQRDIAVFAMAMALLSGCSREEAPRHERTAVVAVRPIVPQVGIEPAIEVIEEVATTVPELAAILGDSADPKIRRDAVYAIADAGKSDDVAIIGQSLTDPDDGVRKAAIEALLGLGGEVSADWLSIGLGDPNPRIRQTAVEALGEIGGDTSRFLLRQAHADADAGVREAAQQMLAEPERAERGRR